MSVTLLPSQTIGILNTIRSGASQAFQERFPEATAENLKDWSIGLKDRRELYNEFVGLLVRIGKVIIDSQSYQNELARFKKGELPYGSTIQDIWVDIATSEGVFDPAGSNPLGRRLSDVQALYVDVNRRDKYVKSISRPQLLNAFTSPERLGDFIMAQINALYSGAEYDEYLACKELLGNYAPFYQTYNVPDVFTTLNSSNLTALVKTMRKAYKDIQFMSREHNAQGVMKKTSKGEATLFIRKDIMAELDVDVLASAFNMDKTTFLGKVVEVEDFGTNDNLDATVGGTAPVSSAGIVAVLIDDDTLQVYDQLKEMATILNPDGLFENYFYHVWQVFYMRKYCNAIAFNVADIVRLKIDTKALTGANAIDYAMASYTVNSKTFTVKIDANTDGTITLPVMKEASNNDASPWVLYTKTGVAKTSGTITETSSAITSIAFGTGGVITVTWASTVDNAGTYNATITA